MTAETFRLDGAVPIVADEATDNEAVLAAVRSDLYPPTNPAVLLRAARWLYLEGRSADMVAVLSWLDTVLRSNSPDLFAGEE